MAKYRIACVMSAIAIAFGMGTCLMTPAAVYAEGEQVQNEEPTVVTTADGLSDAFYHGGNYILGADIDMTGCQYGTSIPAYKDTVLDLDDFTITLPDATASVLTYGANLTIKGNQGKIVKTIENTDYPTVYAFNGDITFESGSIEGKKFPVFVKEGNSFTMNGGTVSGEQFGIVNHGTLTINGGVINSNQSGVGGYDLSETTINNGTINANNFAVFGNGSESGTKFNINGGEINGAFGVYLPQIDGVSTITGGTINASKTGVEIRAGSLEISGGTINVPKNVEYEVIPNGNGATTTGAAVAVAQHTTKQPINVSISGGTFDAPVAFSEANPQKNSEEDIKKVTAEITGGTFGGEIKSEDLVDFVNGGQFTTPPAEEDIVPGHEAEETYEGSGIYEIVPINVDWKDDYLEEAYNDDYAVVVDFHAELIADHRASLNVAEKTDLSGYKLTNGGDLLMALDIDMVDRNNTRIKVKDNNLEVFIDLSEEDYNKLAAYDKVQIVYFDENGNEVERLDATLHGDNGWYWVQFTTTHLSTYGIVGVNESGSGTPETGTMTAAGASATNAAIVTAVAVGLLTSIVSFAYLIRRR